jgi:hypothetical protein
METREHEVGELEVWWIPQVPMNHFRVPVNSTSEAKLILKTLANYDLFQWRNHVKPDYSNAGGLEVWVADTDGEGNPGWEEWENGYGEDIDSIDK